MERKTGQGGSSDLVWHAEDARLDTAVHAISTLKDLNPDEYNGVSLLKREWGLPSEGLEERKIKLNPTSSELRSAPLVVRRIFNDLGVKSGDRVIIEFDIPPVNANFNFTVRPVAITDNRVGIMLSTRTGEGAVIAPVHDLYQEELPTIIKSIPFDSSLSRGKLTEKKALKIRLTYKGIAENVDGNNLFSRNHPHMIEIMTAAANWGVSLVAARKKTTH